MKYTIFVATLLFACATQAAEFKFPAEAPVAVITIPDGWKTTQTETGIEVQSDDDAVYFSIDAQDGKDTSETVTEAVEYLASQNVSVDDSTKKEEEGKLNGMQAYNVYWSGKDSDGPVTIGLTALVADADKTLVLTYWGGTEEQKAHGEEIGAIFNSLKPIAK